MSTFDQYADTPNLIGFEGQEIVLKYERLSASTARVSWNVPPKSSRCGSNNPPAYDGIIVTVDTEHTKSSKLPIAGQKYIADPTADENLHAGDRLGTAKIVAAVYSDRTTNSIDITGLDGSKPYYFSAHAVDAQFRYHTTGVHAYSQDYGNESESGSPAKQRIRIGDANVGVLGSDPTNLDPTRQYSIRTILDDDVPHDFIIDGAVAQTFDDLVAEWSRQADQLDAKLTSPMPPNTGTYFIDSNEMLYEWDGTSEIPKQMVVEAYAPLTPTLNALWWSGSALKRWNGSVWLPVTTFDTNFDPKLPQCDVYWNDGTQLREWTGTVWKDIDAVDAVNDPSAAPSLPKSSHWYNESDYTLYRLDKSCSKWIQTIAQLWDEDPTQPQTGQYWFDEKSKHILQWDGSNWSKQEAIVVEDSLPRIAPTGSLYYVEDEMELYREDNGAFIKTPVFVWDKNPTTPSSGDLWWDEDDSRLFQWDSIVSKWAEIAPFFIQSDDPRHASELAIGTVWHDSGVYSIWDGSEWTRLNVVEYPSNPHTMTNVFWKRDSVFNEVDGGGWKVIDVVESDSDPFTPSVGDFWFDSSAKALYTFNGVSYIPVAYVNQSLKPKIGAKYYNTTEPKLKMWNGHMWLDGEPKLYISFTGTHIEIETSKVGSHARFEITESSLVDALGSQAEVLAPNIGEDGLDSKPSYAQQDVGTDGSSDERRELIDSIRHQLGYPSVDVELTKQQFDYAIDGAIESLRKRSGMAYKRGFYFMDLEPGQQHYRMTDKKRGYNKIVSVLKIHRVRSSFLSNAAGSGLYGQIALQQMYQMGSFDLISYHMVSQYTETLNQMFAGDVMFNWNEDSRDLMIFKNIHKPERMLVEVVVERTEQNMLKDRFLKGWIEKYAMCQCRYMLAEIRGKYAGLPGAGGGVALNGSELAARADQELMDLYLQIEEYVVDNPEEYGGQFILA